MNKNRLEHDQYDVSFDGDQDPMCPRNLPLTRKWILTLIVCSGSLRMTCTSLIYTSSYTQTNADFGTSSLISTLGLSSFLSGLCTFLSVAGGTVGDIFSRNKIQTPMTSVSSAPFIGPSLGPVLGGFINYYLYWRWTYYIMIVWSVTYHPIIFCTKAEKLRKQTNDKQYKAPMENNTTSKGNAIALKALRPFQLLFLEPMCLCLDIYSALLLGILYLFFGSFPHVFRTTHGMNLWQVDLTFLGIIAGMVMAATCNPIWTAVRELSQNTDYLRAIFSGIHWIVPVIGSALFGSG
ncbi:major facilitator superfamily domain-containing protein [Aspergillus alliaceus]|uniref:Major facilitator superfamily domain-containing protein n=1 Tax=Petromyces alliaceus TaxID=209559 RepID=A0A5N7CJR8_PETAA|nr:major facilitator superfamily domain-containing protein [Aspergillus alliaceus]